MERVASGADDKGQCNQQWAICQVKWTSLAMASWRAAEHGSGPGWADDVSPLPRRTDLPPAGYQYRLCIYYVLSHELPFSVKRLAVEPVKAMNIGFCR
jgi:hypothetical protein